MAAVVLRFEDDASGADRRLEQLGLSRAGLGRVCEVAASARNAATQFHPKSAPGSYMYLDATAALRRYLVPLGWEQGEPDGQARTWNVEREVSLVVMTGDEYTGRLAERDPRTRHIKGTATQRGVITNAQLEMFSVSHVDELLPGMRTWVLLLALVDGVLRSELSRPTGMDQAGHVAQWVERILLDEHDVAGDVEFDGDGDGGDDGTGFDVTWND